MFEFNTPRIQYIPPVDRSRETFDQLTSFIPQRQRAQDSANEQAYRNASLARENTRDKNTDERDRISQEQRARQLLMSDKREGERNDVNRLGEERRANTEKLERDKLHEQEHEKLLHDLSYALTPAEAQYAREALKRAGYPEPEPMYGNWQQAPAPIQAQPVAPPAPGPQAAAPPPGAPPVAAAPPRPVPFLPGRRPAGPAPAPWLTNYMQQQDDSSLADPSRLAPDDPARKLGPGG